jgi:AAA15 family ATPase/GTPase
VKALLTFADIGIADFEVLEEETPDEFKNFQRAIFAAVKEVAPETSLNSTEIDAVIGSYQHKIMMMHQGADEKVYPLDFAEESSGTRAYFEMLGPLLDGLRDASGVLIDELESSLHPNLSSQIIRIFSEPSLNPKGAQLLFTSHDTNLLDLGLLRRDQIWFTEKGHDGATNLARLSDFRPRKDQNIGAAYLHGRFGAIPFLDDDLLRKIAASEREIAPIARTEDEATEDG